jgi:predicted MPP superfamily phosphohydrolase
MKPDPENLFSGGTEIPQPTFSVRSERKRPFRITHLEVSVPRLPEEFAGYRIVQLTDLHFGPATTARHIERAIAVSNDLNPDIVVLTGDYVQFSATGIGHAIAHRFNPRLFRWIDYRREVRELASRLGALLGHLQTRDGIFGVFGNHDHLEGVGSIIRQLPQSITWLTNASRPIRRGAHSIIIAGVDDFKRGRPNLLRALDFALLDASVRPEGIPFADPSRPPVFKLLLSHNPDITLSSHEQLLSQVNLILCGHTHGGQIRLPLYGPITTRTRQKLHTSGLSQHRAAAVYTSNGVGYGGIPLRVLCPPEIVSVTLRAKT